MLDFENLSEDSLKKERNIIFQYPIPTFLNMIVGDNFQIKVNENKTRKCCCSLSKRMFFFLTLKITSNQINTGIATRHTEKPQKTQNRGVFWVKKW